MSYPYRKLTREQIAEIQRIWKQRRDIPLTKVLAMQYGVSESTISRIANLRDGYRKPR